MKSLRSALRGRTARFWRVVALVGGLGALAMVPTAWLERLPSVCLYWNLFGVHCPGCGMTRAFSALLHGEWGQALLYNKLVVVAFPAIIGVLVHDAARWAQSRHQAPKT